MIKVKTLRQLNNIKNTHGPVFVRSKNRIYYNFKGEWIPKMYFSVLEVADIADIHPRYAWTLPKKLGIRGNIDYKALLMIIKAVNIKGDNKRMKIVDVKQKLKTT